MTLAAKHLACRRGDRLVFAGLSFRLEPGGALLLAGPNGAGKSSLLRVLAGLTPLLSGRLLWQGAEALADRGAHARRLLFVGHLDAVKPALTVAETLLFEAALRASAGTDAAARAAAVAAALAAFRLDHLADLPGRLLSAGQKRRLALCRLLLAPRPLWLLDEPSVGLDAQAVEDLARVVAAHRARGGLVVASSHLALPFPDAAGLDMAAFAPAPAEAWDGGPVAAGAEAAP